MKKILLMNGPNLNLLGIREPEVYGFVTLSDIEREVAAYAAAHDVRVDCFQSNHEGTLIDKLHDARGVYDGIVYNPGAHTHYSYALRDAISSVEIPTVEVHLSDIAAREDFRRVSVIAAACVAQIKGKGKEGYKEAVDVLLALEPLLQAGSVSSGSLGGSERQASGCVDEQPARALASPRLARLRAACSDKGIRTFLALDTSNIAWLTGFDGVFDDERAHALLVTPHDAVLHTDSRYSTAARAAAADEGVIAIDDERATHAAFVAASFAARHGEQPAARADAVVLGIENTMTLAGFRALEAAFADASARPQLRETSDFVLNLRAVKEPGEIVRLKAAQAITDAAFAHIVTFMRPGMTERTVQVELEDYMRRHGADGLAFPSIVATGANGASPHAIPGETVLESGQCVVLDFGARAHGYCSDMTRTVFIGEPSERMRAAYAAIRSANEQVEAALREGVIGTAMHELAERTLAEAGFAGKMGHGLGHGVGRDIHEQPVLSPRAASLLVAGNVVTVEPGVYLPGEFGMRLEDCGVVTDDGFEVFTQSTHEMVII